MTSDLSRRTCVLHIGVHKTGTTAIQEFFQENREALLKDHQIYFSKKWHNYTGPLRSVFQPSPEKYHFNVKKGVNTAPLAEQQNKSFLRDLHSDVSASEPGHLLISAEGLSTFDLGQVQALKAILDKSFAHYSIIAYLRHPVSWLPSSVQQNLKNGKTLEQILRRPNNIKYRRKILPWISVFGRGAVVLRDYEFAKQTPLGSVSDFCDLLGVDAKRMHAPAMTSNESLTQTAALLLSQLNRLRPYYVDGRISSDRVLNDYETLMKIEGEKFALPADVLKEVENECSQDLTWLEENCGFSFMNPGENERTKQDIPDATLESIALALSDLCNERTVYLIRALKAEALNLWQSDPAGAIEKLKEIFEIDPSDQKIGLAIQCVREGKSPVLLL